MIQNLNRTLQSISKSGLTRGLGLNHGVSDHLLVRPVDPWAGDAARGALVAQGCFTVGGDQFIMRGRCWNPIGAGEAWLDYIHGFRWLRDLRASGGDAARQAGSAYIKNWVQINRDKKSEGWQAGRMGERIAMWISHYDYFEAHDEEFHDLFFPSLNMQARQLTRLIDQAEGLEKLLAAKGLLYAGLALSGYEPLIERALDVFVNELNIQILSDGGHISRSPEALLRALQIYLDVRAALSAGGYPMPEKMQFAIENMGAALRFFVYGDKHLAVMQSGREDNADLIESVLAQSGVRGKTLQTLPSSGYERVSQGRTLLMVDTGKMPPYPHDRFTHASPLGFEMAYGKERIFVSCGSHPYSEDWRESLRATAAHNTLSIDHRNACEIKDNGHMGRKVAQPYVKREESRKACLIEGRHDGYLALNGIIHARRFFLCEQGTDFRGEDTLECVASPARAMEVAIRFHLHPRVIVSLVKDGDEALLRLPSGAGWRFCHTGGALALENSIYLGSGNHPRKTKQLVIYSTLESEALQIKWALQREGI
ncbi:MAG: heparinase II/III family protein [Alphaproteobacteria bacterium]